MMKLLPIFFLLSLIYALQHESVGFAIRTYSPKVIENQPKRDLLAREIPLERLQARSSSQRKRRLLHSLRNSKSYDGIHHSAELDTNAFGQDFSLQVSIGSELFRAIFDTGSSDTWVVAEDFVCVDGYTRLPLQQRDCHFGRLYKPSSSLSIRPNEHLNIKYGSGEFCVGKVGRDNVTLAGITVRSQEIGIVEYTSWSGDGTVSSLVGFAYPSLTSVYSGNDSSKSLPKNARHYSPLFSSVVAQGVPALFSVALSGDDSASLLTIGGLPERYHLRKSAFASADIQMLEILPDHDEAKAFTFYTIYVDGFMHDAAIPQPVMGGSWKSPFRPHRSGLVKHVTNTNNFSATSDIPAVVDTGTTMMLLPPRIVQAVNAKFSPPAKFDLAFGFDLVACNAKPPHFGVSINGTVFQINSRDMIVEIANGVCASGVQDGGARFMVLGDVFLKNVLAVFDVGKSEMRFAAGEFHETP